jgi:hypothetical protein
MDNFFSNLKYICPTNLLESIEKFRLTESKIIWEIKNEIKPIDLYCYLVAKFGSPNGILTLFRNDDSDNLVHWDWILESEYGIITIQGHNFRTEIGIPKEIVDKGLTINDFIMQIKSDFKNYGKEISETKKSLEKWTEFINPFFRIQSTIRILFGKLEELNLDVEKDRIEHPSFFSEDQEELNKIWTETLNKYDFATGLVYGIRSMLPVMAESFINLLIFVLCKPEIKKNERLYQSFLRQQIDIRIQSLPIFCEGFELDIDYTAKECRDFHTLINERNDLLHGNVNIDKQKFGEVYFNSNIPIFNEYQDFWWKLIGVSIQSVKLKSLYDDMVIIENFIDYITSKLCIKTRNQIDLIMSKSRLGYNSKDDKVGILFPSHLIDFRAK